LAGPKKPFAKVGRGKKSFGQGWPGQKNLWPRLAGPKKPLAKVGRAKKTFGEGWPGPKNHWPELAGLFVGKLVVWG
jgi:hypothetical protein